MNHKDVPAFLGQKRMASLTCCPSDYQKGPAAQLIRDTWSQVPLGGYHFLPPFRAPSFSLDALGILKGSCPKAERLGSALHRVEHSSLHQSADKSGQVHKGGSRRRPGAGRYLCFQRSACPGASLSQLSLQPFSAVSVSHPTSLPRRQL